jgi:Uma2 family endonuclease
MNDILMESASPPGYDLTLEHGRRFEWVNDQLRERPPMGAEANLVATALVALLRDFVAPRKLGFIFSEGCGYQAFPHDPKKVRKPDVSFVARGRLPNDRPPRGHVTIAPDIEVEVVSPNDLAEEIDLRVADYLEAGVKLLWIIYPPSRSVWVVRRDGSGVRLTESHELSGEDVLPDFTCPVRTLFADL